MIRTLQDGLKEIVSAVLVLAAVIFFILFFLVVTGNAAEARPHHYRHTITRETSGDPRPRAWCGWQMRQWFGVADRAYNLAAKWRSYGTAIAGPMVGAIVVWYHHVGVITGHTSTGWVIKSGNDAHAIRERERPLRGVIAYRMPSRMAGL